MKVDYVTDMSNWKDWQRDYQFGIILILPPDHVAGEVNRLRAKYDPDTHATCGAHITVSDPLGMEMTTERDAEITELLSTVDPFELSFDKPRASKKRGGVGYMIRPAEPVFALREVLHGASVFTRETYWSRKVAPHMTIAEFVSIEESWQILEEIEGSAPSGSFVCDRLDYIVPDANMHFQRVKSYRLGAQ